MEAVAASCHSGYAFCGPGADDGRNAWILLISWEHTDQHGDKAARHKVYLGDDAVAATCLHMALKINLQTCPAADFASLAMSAPFWEANVLSAAEQLQDVPLETPGWDWFRESHMQTLDLGAPEPIFVHSTGDAGSCVEAAWPVLSDMLMDKTRPMDLLEALNARPELHQAGSDMVAEEDTVQVITRLAKAWPAFCASGQSIIVQ